MRRLVFVGLLLSLVHCGSGDDDTDIVTPRDAGSERDAGAMLDASDGRDAGVERDGGPPRDAGASRDGGPPRDAGFACPLPQIECNGACVNPYEDEANCGACGVVCGGPETCLESVCSGPPLAITASVAPRLIAAGCSPGASHVDSIAIDPANNIYVAMLCGGDARVMRSTDGGQTFTTPAPIGFSSETDVTIAADGPGLLHALAHTAAYALVYSRSEDFGETWSRQQIIDGGPVNATMFTMRTNLAVRRGLVAIAAMDQAPNTLNVYQNASRGVGAFAVTSVVYNAFGGGVLFDPDAGDLLLIADTFTNARLYRSSARGGGFVTEATWPMSFETDGTNGEHVFRPPFVFSACSVSATNDDYDCFHRRDVTTEMSTPIAIPSGFVAPAGYLGYGSVAAGTDGAAYYVVSEGTEKAPTRLGIGRVPAGSTTIDEVRLVGDPDPSPEMNAGPNSVEVKVVPNSTAVVFVHARDGDTYGGIEVF